MRKIACSITFMLVIMSCAFMNFASASAVSFTPEEEAFIEAYKGRPLYLGLDPLSGMDYFMMSNGDSNGVIIKVIEVLENRTGLDFEIVTNRTWNEVYEGLKTGEIDVLFGANETAERLNIMSFTEPIYVHPYAILAHKEEDLYTIGDLDHQNVGFMSGDFVAEALKAKYVHLNYTPVFFEDQEAIFDAIEHKEIKAAVVSGGGIIYKFLNEHPSISYITPIESIVSEMTFSVRKDHDILLQIIDKEIQALKEAGKIEDIINEVEVKFVREIINLTAKERKWLEEDGQVFVGVTEDYLPIDYYEKNRYLGVSGAVLTEIVRVTGMKMNLVYSDFNTLHQGLIEGGVDVLNIVKTDERASYLNFTDPYSYERDIIVGMKTADDVLDIYGLEGKRVAVVDGFWHEAYLRKNLLDVEIVKTDDIVASMDAVLKGKADYFIENPTVVKFYTGIYEAYDLVEKGVTSSDSYLYYGISKRKPELYGIVNKVLPILNLESLRKSGYQSVPLVTVKKTEIRLILIIVALIVLVGLIAIKLKKVLQQLISSQAATEVLKQRQILEFTDVMTGLKNRNYFYKKVEASEAEMDFGGVLMCDIDRLKFVNDTYGHPAGDKLIIEVAKVLKGVLNDSAIPIRMGGDEFLLMVPECSLEKCEQVRSLIKEQLESVKLKCGDGISIDISVSIGYAVREHASESLDEIILRADHMMYFNKRRKWTL